MSRSRYNSRRNTRRGFTLIEVVVYMAIFAIISGIAVNSVTSMSRVLVSLRGARGSTDAVAIAFDRMTRDVRSARSVDVVSSTLGVHPGTLALDTGVRFFLSGPTLMVQEGISTAVPLVPPGVAVTNLVFRKIENGISQGVKIEAVLNGEQVYSTVVLRGSYEDN